MTSKNRNTKDALYGQVALIAKAAGSSKRLELIELLCQGPKTVNLLAEESEISVKLTSAHLKELKAARLVETERQGQSIIYRLANENVAKFWVSIRLLAEDRLVELQGIIRRIDENAHEWKAASREELLQKAREGDLVIIDVRPSSEYEAGHLPYARSLPHDQLKTRLKELPKDKTVVAYCRGPFCFWASEAVAYLRSAGFEAWKIRDGVAEWQMKVG